MGDLLQWYYDIPVVSRVYLTAAVATTTACFLDLVSPLTLYYNYDLIVGKGQYWRLLSSFLFFGSFSLDFLFHMYFVIRYCRLLEEGPFRGRKVDFVWMMLVGAALMLLSSVAMSSFTKIKFLGHPLAFMMVYVWARGPENLHVRMSLLGIFPFSAPYVFWYTLILPSFLVCDLSVYLSVCPSLIHLLLLACLHSLTPHGTTLTIIPIPPPSIINTPHHCYYNTGTQSWTSRATSSTSFLPRGG